MPCDIKQNGDGSTGMHGTSSGDGEFITLEFFFNANSVDSTIFTASRPYVVKSVIFRPDVAGTDAGAVTAAVKIAPSGTAIASGTAVHSGTANLKAAAHTNQVATLSTTPSDVYLPAGSSIGVDFTGTLTNAQGCVSIALCPA